MPKLTNDDLYSIYQENRKLLEREMEQVKNMTIQKIGVKEWNAENYKVKGFSGNSINGQIEEDKMQVLAGTRLYTFLLCSWLETKLHIIVYEKSSVGFTDAERLLIEQRKEMEKKWKVCFNLALCKGCSISYAGHEPDLEKKSDSLFMGYPSVLRTYDIIFNYLDMIKGAISVRNRLAHGQWMTQLNSASDNYADGEIKSFINSYNNIMKLDLLFQMFEEISEVISSYVIYKERETTRANSFNNKIDAHIKKINQINKQIEKKSFSKYSNKALAQEKAKRKLYYR